MLETNTHNKAFFATSLNHSFGLLFALFFVIISIYLSTQDAKVFTVYGLLTAGAVVGAVAIFSPKLLAPFSKAWMKFGDLMGKVISPLMLCVIFYCMLSPVALVTRLFGRDEMRLKRRDTLTYWIDRTPPGPAPDSFNNQF